MPLFRQRSCKWLSSVYMPGDRIFGARGFTDRERDDLQDFLYKYRLCEMRLDGTIIQENSCRFNIRHFAIDLAPNRMATIFDKSATHLIFYGLDDSTLVDNDVSSLRSKRCRGTTTCTYDHLPLLVYQDAESVDFKLLDPLTGKVICNFTLSGLAVDFLLVAANAGRIFIQRGFEFWIQEKGELRKIRDKAPPIPSFLSEGR